MLTATRDIPETLWAFRASHLSHLDARPLRQMVPEPRADEAAATPAVHAGRSVRGGMESGLETSQVKARGTAL